MELVLPIPRDRKTRQNLANRAKEIIESRAKYREQARALPTELQGKALEEIEDEVERYSPEIDGA